MNASGKRYIFCVSPGRSGTHYLQQLFSCAKDICAVHEPEHQLPEYTHLKPYLWDLKNTTLASTGTERRHAKLAQVNDILTSTGAGIYAETNPLFSTLWHDVLLDALSDCDLTVIILRRDASAVLKSLLDLGWFQERDGNQWMVTAYSVNSPLKAPVSEGRASPAELIIGYLLNVESNARQIKRCCEQQGHGVVELYSQQLFEEENAIDTLLSCARLEPDMERLARLNTESRNKQTIRKKITDIPVEACRRELDHYIDSCREHGIDVPDLYYL